MKATLFLLVCSLIGLSYCDDSYEHIPCSPPNTKLQLFPDQDLYYHYTPVIAGVPDDDVQYYYVCDDGHWRKYR